MINRKKQIIIFLSCLIPVFLVSLFMPVNAIAQKNSLYNIWTQINQGGFGDPENYIIRSIEKFHNHLYAGTANENGDGAQLWRSDVSGNWNIITEDGFGNNNNIHFSDLIKFKNKFFVGTRNIVEGGKIYQSRNGLDWNHVNLPGLSPRNGEILHFINFDGDLYASTMSFSDNYGAEIWRSATGNDGDWEQVVINGFNGDEMNQMIVSMEIHQGRLFVGTDNWNGTEIWSSLNGTDWAQVNVDGFDDPNNWSATLESYQGYLYAATYNWYLSDNPGFELWRCKQCDGSDWVQIPIENGFGDSENRAIRALVSSLGKMYGFVYNRKTGIQLWQTENGIDWEQLIGDGFGDANNLIVMWDTSVLVNGNEIIIGTWNKIDGGEIWKGENE